MWNSVEVHAIYGLFYTLCMSQEGLQHLRDFFSAKDTSVYHPLFIAQYLLVPVNTIVKSCLLPWMMEKYFITSENGELKKIPQFRPRAVKAEIFLRYSLLVDLLHIVKTYGRNPDYDFRNDEKLAVIRNEYTSDNNMNDKTKMVLTMDSFMTIWLLTLPEQFKEWEKQHYELNNAGIKLNKRLSFTDSPSFPHFVLDSYTSLVANPDTKSFELLPPNWNLMECFEHFLDQIEQWTTRSINYEFFELQKKKNSKNNIPKTNEALSDPCDDEDMNIENEEAEAEDDGKDEKKRKGENVGAVAIKQSTDSENEERLLRATDRKRSHSGSSRKKGQRKKKAASKDFISPRQTAVLIDKLSIYISSSMSQVEELETLLEGRGNFAIERLNHNLTVLLDIQQQLTKSVQQQIAYL
jgi:hypothetical protein